MGRSTNLALMVRFALFAAVAFCIAWVDALPPLRQGAQTVRGAFVLENFFLLLPGVLGVTLASFRHAEVRGAARLTALVVAMMVAIDFVPPSGVSMTSAGPAMVDGQLIQSPSSRWNSAGAIATVGGHLLGAAPGEAAPSAAYELDHPRRRLAHAYARIAFLLLPVAVAGLIVGGIRWMDRTMLFTSRATEVVVEFVVGWVVGPLVILLASQFSYQTVSLALFDGYPVAVVLLPSATLVGLSLGGWITAGEERRR